MMKILHKIGARFRSDRADSLVTAIIVFPLVVSLIITGVDFGMFLNAKSTMVNTARDGARSVAILGGNGSNVISKKYGKPGNIATRANVTCNDLSSVECDLYDRLWATPPVMVDWGNEDKGNMSHYIKCGPEKTSYVGEQVWCQIRWRYMGLPLSSLSLVSLGKQKNGTDITPGEENPLGIEQVTKGYASAETNVK